MFKKIVLLLVSIFITALVGWVNFFSPFGIINQRDAVIAQSKSTERLGLLPCVICGHPGHLRKYVMLGAGPNFQYKGPYIYCDKHFCTSPMNPNEDFLMVYLSSIVVCILLSCLTYYFIFPWYLSEMTPIQFILSMLGASAAIELLIFVNFFLNP